MRDLSESEAPQAAMEIPCAWRVVTQKRETVLFGAEDSGGWSSGADAGLGGAGEGAVAKGAWPLGLLRPWVGKGLYGAARPDQAAGVCPWALTDE